MLFASPILLWESACEYFEWCDNNPWFKKDWVGKDANEVDRPNARPYTMSGLCLFLDCSESYFRVFKSNPPKKASEDFLTVITRIEQTIYTQKFEGAVVGAFNANIISRDLGLVDKKEVSDPSATPDLTKLSDEELDLYITLKEKTKRG
ncbi:DNA-packaging protein [Rufibacter quisquiliarum]|uniref:DNA-packaging protein gp3 n=1 Tax=Rufibacter quisquiliarum TaxID=1549639 RepID=A0A839GMD0_9BACT|nr:DNA-packaging protein [Rufibacter quisquiliarum]MBA9076087.1 hypothetical protein [Rufibacter quisquiliarum]